MDNVFFQFVETYWDDIAEFFKALMGWIEAFMGKMNAEDAENAEAAE